MSKLNQDGAIELSEKLMQLGWWDEAKEVLDKGDIDQADKMLQGALLTCRRECCEFISYIKVVSTRDLLSRFDRYTVLWAITEYQGKERSQWQISGVEVNGKTV